MNEGAAREGRGTAADLWRLQLLARHTVVISATQKCPLSCAHCITSSSRDAPGAILSPELAEIWSADFPAMAADGLRHLTLTGGEPILALDAVGLLVRAAAAEGILPFVVTSGAWATTPAAARNVVARAGPVARWDIGVDGWHAEQMPLARIGHALTAIIEAGGGAIVRMCESSDPATTRAWRDEIEVLVDGRAPILIQSVRQIGRARRQDPGHDAVDDGGLPRRPCVSTGLFVRADGSTGPCCSGLAYEAVGRHPLRYGSVRSAGALHDAWRAWRADPLLRLMRVASLAALDGWMQDTPVATARFSDDPCEACVAMWPLLSEAEADALRVRAASTAVATKLDALEALLQTTLLNDELSSHASAS
ncbi:radical SAM protein [Bradyrhizobium sp. HKCCYLS20291]|uniref:radical SAM protein n=1 Tax=Bradyrhizobium sp. HKCCYLS20291 TaxID=3420766 RepID=UPI003EB978A1